MRTVHETEALRPSDPIPRAHPAISLSTPSQPAKLQRIKLKMPGVSSSSGASASNSANADSGYDMDANNAFALPDFPSDLGFDEEELRLSPSQLYRLLRRQIHWAEKEGADLRTETEAVEAKRKAAYREKHLVFDDVVSAEVKVLGKYATHLHEAYTASAEAVQSSGSGKAPASDAMDISPATKRARRGSMMWQELMGEAK